ncbi:hypothetical protein [Amnibacterium sp.]|uniref:hypothetical protein n=1 Tax=Amnibacterium sp. TaxID=1872496 RepID=UPI00260CE77D|nr:hypothetical protein [Amnibacterium sp.]MCU1473783.1 hypothetical protein [Amnibacterium sp.]
MIRRLVVTAAAAAAALAALAGPADASPVVPQGTVGVDVSFPQCSAFPGFPGPILTLPLSSSFVVVGLNEGVAATVNDCLGTELAWAGTPARDRRVDLYLNTADPGPTSARWPTSSVGSPGTPYGQCRAGDAGPACAYAYGAVLARADLAVPGLPAPATATWWLDVESANTWSGTTAAHRAVLEGMTAALHAAGAHVGVYAARGDWTGIVGTVPATSPLYGVHTWLAGATTAAGAAENCTHAPLTAGGRIDLAQYTGFADTVDSDLACRVLHVPSRPTITGTASVRHPLTARSTGWAAGTRLTYQWLRNGHAIAGATGRTHLVNAADRGTRLAVRVTALRTGSSRAQTTSANRLVAR